MQGTEEQWHTHKRYSRWVGEARVRTSGLVPYWEEWLRVNDVLQRQRPSWEWWALTHREGDQR